MKTLLLSLPLFICSFIFAQESNPTKTCVSGNCKNGFGKSTYSYGAVYEGNFKNGLRHGKGTETRDDGLICTGEFIKDEQKGMAKISLQNGDTWEGESKNCYPSGMGKMNYLGGSYYMGRMLPQDYGTKVGDGIYTLKNGYSLKGHWEDYGKLYKADYFDAENSKITQEKFENQKEQEALSYENKYTDQYKLKFEQFILKNKGVIVKDITIPDINSLDISSMSFRTANVEELFSDNDANLFCVIRQKIKPSCYDYNSDVVTAYSTTTLERLFSGAIWEFTQTAIGKKVMEKYDAMEKLKLNPRANYNLDSFKDVINDLNNLTAPAGNVQVADSNENFIIFEDVHREDKGGKGKSTFYFINKETKICEKIINVNTSWYLVWNDDGTKACITINKALPAYLVPDVYKFDYFRIHYMIDFNTYQAKLIDDHVNQLNFLSRAEAGKKEDDASYARYNAENAAINKRNNEIINKNAAIQAERTAKCMCCLGTGKKEVKGMYMGTKTVSVTPVNGLGISHEETVSQYGKSTFSQCPCCH